MEQSKFTPQLCQSLVQRLLLILNKRAVIFFTGGKGDPQALIKMVDDTLLLEPPIVISENFNRLADPSFLKRISHRLLSTSEQVEESVAQADLAVIPIFTRSAMAKAALGIADTLVTYGIARALMHGKSVISIRSSGDKSGNYCPNPAYNRLLLEYERTLQGFGVRFVETDSFFPALKHQLYPNVFKVDLEQTQPERLTLIGRLITLADIQNVPYQGEITIATDALVTPLARDYLSERRVSVIRV